MESGHRLEELQGSLSFNQRTNILLMGHRGGMAELGGPLHSSYCCLLLISNQPSIALREAGDPAGSQAEPPPPAASGEASEKAPPPGPGPSVSVREQQPLSSLSSVLLYRVAPEALRLVFYDEVWSE